MELGQKGSHNIFTVANRYYCIQERCTNCPVTDADMAVSVLLAANCFEETLNCYKTERGAVLKSRVHNTLI